MHADNNLYMALYISILKLKQRLDNKFVFFFAKLTFSRSPGQGHSDLQGQHSRFEFGLPRASK